MKKYLGILAVIMMSDSCSFSVEAARQRRRRNENDD